MVIDLAALRLGKKPLAVERSFDRDDFQIKDETIELGGPVQVELNVSASDERVRVEGRISGELILACCRCACEFRQATEKVFSVEYWPDEDEEEGEIELDYDDLDVGFYSGDQFDLKEVILEQMLIDIPMNPICRDDCKGLCARCGADLNKEECGCGENPVDPRLQALKDWKNRAK